MSIIRFLCITLILFFSAGSAWAGYTWSAIASGPPEFGYVDDYSTPAHVSVSEYGREIEAQAGWWDLGASIHSTWDSSYQGFVWADAQLNKDFVVTSEGPASISFSLSGMLQVSADPTYDDRYFVYSSASIDDNYGPLGNNPSIYWYDELDNSGIMPISHTATFNYDFSAGDIGEEFTVDFYLDLEVSPYPFGQVIDIAQGDSIELTSGFNDGFKIDSITGGIAPADGPALVPIPPTFWLFAPAIIAIFGVRRKSNRLSANTQLL